MQTFTLFFLSLFAFAYALPVPFSNDESASRLATRVSATPNPSNATTSTNKHWLNDITLAQASGIDAFALNMGSDDWQPARVADAYAAAQNSSLDFKMFLSLDMSVLPCSSAADATSLRALVTTYLSHPNQLRYSRGSSPLPLVSTFAGETCQFGQGSVAEGWSTQFSQHPDLQGKITFIPSFFVSPSQMSQFNGIVDGTFNWNGGWPIELTTDSAGSSESSLSSSLTSLLGLNTTTNAIGKLSNAISTSNEASSSTTTSGVLNIEDALGNFIGSTNSDNQFLEALGTANSTYIAAVSPWFFTHFAANSFNKNFLYLADQHLYSKRWESLISAQAPLGDDADPTNATTSQPSIADQVDIVEIISWNDYGESHYVGPIEGALPTGSEAWTNGMNHTAWLSLTSYYAAAFKTGFRIIMWSRTHPASANATGDDVGPVLDAVWAITLLSEPANTFAVPAGLSKLTIPISVPDSLDSVSMRGTVQRGDESVIELDAGSQGFEFVKTPQQYNYNAFAGCAGGGCVV
ncbi:glycoside hydrolase [Gymnopus androsaceus JB14]|uniref:Glycoside hydrolase n=1 Tax=Gymnopus androsaceus JB14 TaxID=1447944 RepID=A0A6A4GSC7_9AGAR|nr:glycoside hydrolase [Gymnopus androsaceus JB14]